MTKSYRGMLYIFISASLLSTSGLFIKKLHIDPLAITVIRSIFAGLTLLPFIKFKELKLKLKEWSYIAAFAFMVITFIVATKLTPSANVVALQYTAPLYIYLLNVFMKKIRVRWDNLLPMVFIILGIASFILEPKIGSSFLGNMLALVSGVALAAMTVTLPKIKNTSPIALVCISNLFTGIVALPFIPSYSAIFTIDTTGWLCLIYLGCFQVAVSYVLYVKGVQYTSSLQAMILAMFEAIMNPIWVVIFIGEVPSIYGLVGGIMILSAVLGNIILQNRVQRKDAEADYLEKPAI